MARAKAAMVKKRILNMMKLVFTQVLKKQSSLVLSEGVQEVVYRRRCKSECGGSLTQDKN